MISTYCSYPISCDAKSENSTTAPSWSETGTARPTKVIGVFLGPTGVTKGREELAPGKCFRTVNLGSRLHPPLLVPFHPSMRHLSVFTLAALALLVARAPLRAAEAGKVRPNVIVFYTDDHGHADLGIQGFEKDVRTPHMDSLARSGVLATNGYSTAPQCVPSRAGLLTGRFQGRFNLDANGGELAGFDQETTFPARLQKAGYVTAQFGKWHLGPDTDIVRHGFTHVFAQNRQAPFAANVELDGRDRPLGDLPPAGYHLESCARAAAALIERHQADPFFLYVAFRAPHTPLDAPKRLTDRFPGDMPERRRQALAMISAVDDGVGLVTETLKKLGLTERTLIFLIGDNGAPLKIHKQDSPLDGDAGGWDGSLNTPLNGEKGMLAEGGMHVPFVIAWPGTIPAGQRYNHPVSALDVAATAAALAGIETKPGELDGVNLVPYLKGEIKTRPHETLCWRWVAQSAIREGDWKLLRGGDREYLYDLAQDPSETNNVAPTHPEIAARLRGKLAAWAAELNPPGLALAPMAKVWNDYFDHYLDHKTIAAPAAPAVPKAAANQGWEARNGTLTEKDGVLQLTPDEGAKAGSAFLTRNQLSLKGPVTATVVFKTATAGEAGFAWRLEGEKDFVPANRVNFAVTASGEWQTRETLLPAAGTVIHLRLHLPGGTTFLREIKVETAAK